MKIGILSGAIKNAGDYLIVDRTIQLLKKYYSDAQIIKIYRNKPLDGKLRLLNSCDVLVLAGGPVVMENVYPDFIPLVKDFSRLKTKIVSVGLGWYGDNDRNEYLYNYKISPSARKLFDKLSSDFAVLCCRDYLTVDVLKNNGYKNVILTGCPAWYNLETLGSTKLREDIKIPFRKICISDAAKSANRTQSVLLAKLMRNRYKDSEIFYVCHRDSDNQTAIMMRELGVKFVDVSGGIGGLNIYDDCDLHIGYRVHAHIYNLSQRNISVLIEEDARGAGIDRTLGLSSIKAYDTCGGFFPALFKHFDFAGSTGVNKYVLKEVCDYLYHLETSNYKNMEYAYRKMQDTYMKMEKVIKEIGQTTKH